MTQQEWEEELQKHLSVLPANEMHKVLEYYDELYEDKSELGLNSADIIKEFGNPIDVANKIIEENTLSKLEQPYLFDDSNKEVCAKSESIAQDASSNNDKILNNSTIENEFISQDKEVDFNQSNINNFVILEKKLSHKFFFINAFNFILNFSIWFCIIMIGFIFFAVCFALIFGGIASIIMVAVASVTGAELYYNIGVYLICIAIGIFMVFITKYILKLFKRLTKKIKEYTKTKKINYVNRRLNNENTK